MASVNSKPSIRGISMSVITRSTSCSWRSFQPASPSAAVTTSYPAASRMLFSRERVVTESSTTSSRFFASEPVMAGTGAGRRADALAHCGADQGRCVQDQRDPSRGEDGRSREVADPPDPVPQALDYDLLFGDQLIHHEGHSPLRRGHDQAWPLAARAGGSGGRQAERLGQ